MEYAFIMFQAEFKNAAERDRAARYLAKNTRPDWGDDYPDEDDAIFEAVDDCVYPLAIQAIHGTGLRWVCSGGEYDDIPGEWPERLKAMSGTTVICVSAGGEINWQVMQYDCSAPDAVTKTVYVTRFYDDRERDQPIEDFERQFTTPEWEIAMFDCDEETLLSMANAMMDTWHKVLAADQLPAALN